MILAIDPGNIDSAFVLIKSNTLEIVQHGKISNELMIDTVNALMCEKRGIVNIEVVIEMIASYGMPVGKEVFETCVFIGRLIEACKRYGVDPALLYRKDVKVNLCGTPRAKDGNVIQAMKDRFGDRGTKKNPGWFYGVKADVWQAYAVGVTYSDAKKQFQIGD